MKYLGIKLIILMISYQLMGFTHVFDRIPTELVHTDYVFVVEIETQTNYLFYKRALIDQFSVSTGSKTRYKGNREMKEGVWRLGLRMEKDLAPIYGARLIYLEKYNPRTNQFFKTNKAFHGTNEPYNIGKPTSMGCVYHYDEDIIDLYNFIPTKTLVITIKKV